MRRFWTEAGSTSWFVSECYSFSGGRLRFMSQSWISDWLLSPSWSSHQLWSPYFSRFVSESWSEKWSLVTYEV